MYPIILPLLFFGLISYFHIKEECKQSSYWEYKKYENHVVIHYTKCGDLNDEFRKDILNRLQPYIEKEYGNEIEIKFKRFHQKELE